MADIELETPRLVLRNWRETDRESFYRLNHDEPVMHFFPFRRSRPEADRVMDEMAAKFRTQGYCFAAMALKETEQCVGICGINPTTLISHFSKGTVEIGWRVLPEFWGKGLATEAAIAWRDYGFQVLHLPEIVAFAVTSNSASHRVMERIGMTRRPELDFDHPKVSASFPQLVRYSVHMITRGMWHRLDK